MVDLVIILGVVVCVVVALFTRPRPDRKDK